MRKTKDTKTKKTTSNTKKNSLLTFIKSEQFPKTMAVLLAIFTVFCFVSFVSFFWTWFNDYNLVQKLSFSQLFFGEQDIKNWGGPLGACVAYFFVNKTFGVASFGFLILFALAVLRLFKVQIQNIRKWIVR